ncbi:stalk domain-containing protein [Paenibacillus allorhizosphaerae]|nr:stalk domain-containing protein [Paenibacillus allorhizosphaerae]
MQFDVDPILEDGTTLVQFRPLFEKMGLGITWNANNKTIRGTSEDGNLIIDLQINVKIAAVNGMRTELDVAPKIIDGNTMVPLRFVSEATGKRVSWNPSDRLIKITKGVELVQEAEQYGDESYDPDNYSSLNGKNNINVFEKDDKTFVVWDKDVTLNNERYTYFYMSIAQNGKWISKASVVRFVKRDKEGQNLKFVSGDSIYWRNSGGVQKWTIGSSGVVTDEVYAVEQPFNKTYASTPEILNVVYRSNGEPGILFGDNINLALYFDNRSYSVKDLNRVLFSAQPDTKYVFDDRTGRLSIFQGTTIRQLDIYKGDILYENGKDKVTTISPNSFSYSVYSEGKMNVLYMGNDRRMRLVTVDDDLRISEPMLTNYRPKNPYPMKLVVTDKYFHLWGNIDFNRRPALYFVSLSK